MFSCVHIFGCRFSIIVESANPQSGSKKIELFGFRKVIMKELIKRLISKTLRNRGLMLSSTKYFGTINLKAETIPGWFTSAECEKLYRLAMITDGSILEIGHFLGKSTACICEAIKDSQKKRDFKSYDMGFVSENEFKAFFDKVHKRDVPVPSLAKQIYSQNTTSTELAARNLKNAHLDEYVKLISGNFINLDHDLYDLIFCDAMHDSHEIELNLPHVMTRSSQKCIWAFHDMNDSNIDLVVRISKAIFIERAQSLGIFLFVGTKNEN